MTVALVTDSNAQLPPALIARYGIRVVPLTIVINGEPRLEGVDLDPTEFYTRLRDGATVSTAAPSPGEVLVAYDAAAAAGATSVLSIHIGSNTSATLNAVTIAASMSPVPVTIVDTETASFAVGCCVWQAGEVLSNGGEIAAAEAAARQVAGSIGNVFVAGALSLAARGGRLDADAANKAVAGTVGEESVPVLALEQGTMRVVDRVRSIDAALDAMCSYIETQASGASLRIGVGDALADDVAVRLVALFGERLGGASEVVRYAIGPSVGAHTGIGTIGAVFFPR